MIMEILAVGGIMDINTKEDINTLMNLLETLTALRVTFTIDKMLVDTTTGKCQVVYVHGIYDA